MSMSRSPSPPENGGWATPGLTQFPDSSRRGTAKSYGSLKHSQRDVTWASAKARSAQFKRYPPRSSQDQAGFFGKRLARTLSASLPRFNLPSGRDYSDKEKLGRGRWGRLLLLLWNLAIIILKIAWRLRLQLAVVFAFIMAYVLFYVTPLHAWYRRTSYLGGGNKFVLILAANPGGGVMEWKGPREWAIERHSVQNKRRYAARWGYSLEIVDMRTKKRYAHEWRESWEKVDTIRRCMTEYPEAEWFWWLDLTTFIMEPSYSLQKHIFDDLENIVYRDINEYNPLNLTHPPAQPYLDDISKSATGDGDVSSINLLVSQDCSGFNLGSFFMRRSEWSDRLLDIWWDPVHYEQKHMQWEHKEQDALEYLYRSHPWIRSSFGFLPQRKASSYPPGACAPAPNKTIHYDRNDRDFLVNLAGCQWGRDCWNEMYTFREISNKLNRTWWEKFKDGLSDGFRWFIGLFKKKEKKTEEEQKKDAKAA